MAARPTASAADEIDISAIRVGQRPRKGIGDIGALAVNIAEVGLLHPVVVTRDMRLIAGGAHVRTAPRLNERASSRRGLTRSATALASPSSARPRTSANAAAATRADFLAGRSNAATLGSAASTSASWTSSAPAPRRRRDESK